MVFATYIPDVYLIWLWKQSIRIGASLVALGIIAFLLSLVFRVLAMMLDALHQTLHQALLLCTSINSTFVHSGLVGQAVIICIAVGCLIWFFYRFYQVVRGGQQAHENI